MRPLNEFFLFFHVKWFLFKEGREVRRRFPAFSVYERAFEKAYRFSNPFRICKSYLRQRGEEQVDAYGETPLPVLAKIAQECAIKSEDVLIELGCGRGRGAFFLSHLIGCRVIGIDWVPFFIGTAKAISETIEPRLPLEFCCEGMQTADFSRATVIYLYGTCLNDEAILELISRFEKLPSSVKIITVSYPLSEYSPRFCTLKQFSVTFPWGEAEVFIQYRL
jgi:SAM-dependent methyltransferase